ncbi:hypothetical protein PFLCHA0_c60730 [Pseudomonas protegens CHA0]|uniref:Uncharacterized protein n=1 Tax=Pseudomonas protegens (strain DSM 19095 / LMG 27888 / CFBP 6595 / CHA0) TaxID=1124983 RepID=A0A2C9EW54_PSEPH|nr:hypothetical protein PFLCHA0_c60730 [Pseudomonas protegens CHA0]
MDPDLENARANGFHRPAIVGLFTLLQQIQLETGGPTGIFRERPEIPQRAPDKHHILVPGHRTSPVNNQEQG